MEYQSRGVKQDESQKSAGVNECGSFDQEVFDRQSHWGHLDLPESISPGRKDPEIRKLLESTFQCSFHNDQEAGKLLKLSRVVREIKCFPGSAVRQKDKTLCMTL